MDEATMNRLVEGFLDENIPVEEHMTMRPVVHALILTVSRPAHGYLRESEGDRPIVAKLGDGKYARLGDRVYWKHRPDEEWYACAGSFRSLVGYRSGTDGGGVADFGAFCGQVMESSFYATRTAAESAKGGH